MADENRDSGVDRAGKEAFTALQQPIWPAGDGEMASRIRAFDWSVTPLGPSVGWPQSLKTVVDLMLDSAFPSYVWWGPDLIQFCNDPAIGINGAKHPGLLGTPAREGWTELWGVIGDLAEKVFATGRPERGDLPMVPDRGGPAQTAWFTFSYSALRTEDGTVCGIFITGIETTEPLTGHFRLSDVQRTAELAGSGQTVVVNDASADPRLSPAERASYAAMEVAAGIGVPLIKDGRWVAGLGVHHATPRHWTPEDIDLVREVAERIWAAVERARAEAALRESEARFRTLFDNMAEGFALFDVVRGPAGQITDMLYREANRALEHRTGFDRARTIGRTLTEILTPSDAARFIPLLARAVDPGESGTVEECAEIADRWFEVTAYPHGPEKIAVFYRDISERKRAEFALRDSEARQAFLLKFSDALRPLGDPVEVQTAALRVLGEHLGAVRAQYWEVEPDGQHAHSEGGYAKEGPHLSGRVRLNDFGIHLVEALAAGLTVVVRDVTTDPLASEAVLAAYDAVGIRAFVTVPLVKGGRLVALLTIHHADARDWTHQEIALVEEAAERTWAAVERALAEAELRQSEERLRTLFDSIDEGFMEVEVVMSAEGRAVDWRYLTLNASFERLTGLADITGMLVSELMPDLEPEWAERYTQVVNTGAAMRFELPASGLGRWFDVFLSRVGDAGSRRVAAVYNDITERKRAEIALREGEARQAYLLKFSDALRAEPNAEAIADRAIKMLFQYMKLDRCYVGVYRLAADIAEFPHQVYDDRLPPLPAQVRLSDFPEALRAAFDRTLVIGDIARMEGLSDSERASFAGLGMGGKRRQVGRRHRHGRDRGQAVGRAPVSAAGRTAAPRPQYHGHP